MSYILFWSGYIQQLDIHKGGRQKKACHYLQTVRESTGSEDEFTDISRYTLQGIRKEQGEPVDGFISRLNILAAKCQFRDNIEVEDRVLDQFIWWSRNPDIKKSLINRDKSLTLAADK